MSYVLTLALAVVAAAASGQATGSRLNAAHQQQQHYAQPALLQSMERQEQELYAAKHLVYTAIGSDPDYIRLLKWLLRSMSHYSRQPNYQFLVVVDVASKPAVDAIIRSQPLRFKVDCMVLDSTEVDKPGEKPAVAASARKLDIYRYQRLREFTNLLYIDIDHLFTVDASELLSIELQPGVLYAHTEQRVMRVTPPKQQAELFHQSWWGFQNYTDDEIEFFREHNVVPFSAGCYMFKNTPEMIQVMRALKEEYLAFQGTNYFYEQTFLNHYFNKRLLANTTLLTPYLLEYWTVAKAAGTYSWSKKIVHFTQAGAGPQREALMRKYFHMEVLSRRHVKMAVLSSWLKTVTAFALESLPEEHRAGWFDNMGHIGQVPREVERYYTLAARPGIKTICEVGFNAGHSAAVFMAANPFATVYTFDLMQLPYSKRAVSLFKSLQPDTFHFVKGSSFHTLPWLHKTRPDIQCGLFSVDGNHEYQGALTDFLNAHAMMPIGATMIADDISTRYSGCEDAWDHFVAAGYLEKVVCEVPQQYDANAAGADQKRWCWGTVALPHQKLTPPYPARYWAYQLDTGE